MIKFEDIVAVNKTLKTVDVRGKQYAEVNQRIKGFRQLFPEGTIDTTIISLAVNAQGHDVVTMRAVVRVGDNILGTGHAQEVYGSTKINTTSYIENCETSAVGRALAMCGIGIDTSVASAEEVDNAIEAQDRMKIEAQDRMKNVPQTSNYGEPPRFIPAQQRSR